MTCTVTCRSVSVENKDYVDRIDDLRATGSTVKFLSLEPLLGEGVCFRSSRRKIVAAS